MSSIIASRRPPAVRSTSGTTRGTLSRCSRPIDWASRRAGSMVSTHTRRPCSAARRASAAAVVVLPTPPEPQHTMIPVPRLASSASISRRGAAVPGISVLVEVTAHSPQALVSEGGGKLVQPAEVDALSQPGQFEGRQTQRCQGGTLGCLQGDPVRGGDGLTDQRLDDRG